MKLQPSGEDYAAVVREYGSATTEKEQAEHYRLAQAFALIRLYDQGKLPVIFRQNCRKS